MATIAEKHGNGDANFAAFEAKHGSVAAENLLQRICEEQWAPGTEQGVIFHDVVAHDACNHTITGCIEHEDVWYHFVLRNGNMDGTQVEEFDLDDPDITDRPPELAIAQRLADCLLIYLETHPHARQAGYSCMGSLRKMHKVGRVSAATTQTHALLRGILGDLAYRMQDYALDALKLASQVMTASERVDELYAELSPELQAALEAACKDAPELGGPVEFLTQGLEPVFRYQLL